MRTHHVIDNHGETRSIGNRTPAANGLGHRVVPLAQGTGGIPDSRSGCLVPSQTRVQSEWITDHEPQIVGVRVVFVLS